MKLAISVEAKYARLRTFSLVAEAASGERPQAYDAFLRLLGSAPLPEHPAKLTSLFLGGGMLFALLSRGFAVGLSFDRPSTGDGRWRPPVDVKDHSSFIRGCRHFSTSSLSKSRTK